MYINKSWLVSADSQVTCEQQIGKELPNRTDGHRSRKPRCRKAIQKHQGNTDITIKKDTEKPDIPVSI